MRRRFLSLLLGLPAATIAAATRALKGKNATFANPAIFVGLVQWCDKVMTE